MIRSSPGARTTVGGRARDAYTVPMSERLFDAIEFAAKAHRGQFRKTTRVPYLVHPLAVAQTLIEWGAPEDVVIAGLLHDTVEDTATTLGDLVSRFGEEVAVLVSYVSEPEKSLPWEARKAHTLEVLRRAPVAALTLACADKLDNLRSMAATLEREGEALWTRFKRGREAQRGYYGAIAELVRARGAGTPWGRAYLQAFAVVFPA